MMYAMCDIETQLNYLKHDVSIIMAFAMHSKCTKCILVYLYSPIIQNFTHNSKVHPMADSWYRHGLMVLTTLMVLTQTHGIVSVLNHTLKGPSGACMHFFF